MTMQPETLKRLRTGSEATQAELAEAIGMSTTFFGLMERGKSAMEPRTELAIYQALDNFDRGRAANAIATNDYPNLVCQMRDLRIAFRHLQVGDLSAISAAGIALEALTKPSGIIQYHSMNSYPGVLNTLAQRTDEETDVLDLRGLLDISLPDGGGYDGEDTFAWWDQPVLVVRGEPLQRGDIIQFAAAYERDLCDGREMKLAKILFPYWSRQMVLTEELPEMMMRFAFEVLRGGQLVGRY